MSLHRVPREIVSTSSYYGSSEKDILWVGLEQYPCPNSKCDNNLLDSHHTCMMPAFKITHDDFPYVIYYCECYQCEITNSSLAHYFIGEENDESETAYTCYGCNNNQHPRIEDAIRYYNGIA